MGLKRAFLWVVWLLSAGCARAEGPGSVLADTLLVDGPKAVFWADWDEVERLDAAARQDARRAANGGLAFCQMRDALNWKYASSSLAYHEAHVVATAAWAARRPELPVAHVAHLQALSQLAWFHRGGGYVSSVSEQRLQDFHRTLDRAVAYAQRHAAILSSDPLAAAVMTQIVRAQGGSVAQQLAVARRGLTREPWNECLYRVAVTGLVPRWGGRPQQLEAWVRESMQGLSEEQASMRYARMYNDAVDQGYEQTLFADTLVQWPLMRQGLERLAQTHSAGTYWRDRRAYLACMAGDRDAAVQALERIDKPDADAWGGGREVQRNYQACRRWALQS